MRLASAARRHPTRRQVLAAGALIAGGLLVDATAVDRHNLRVEARTVRLPHLPTAFQGFRIAHISDVHYERYMEPWFLRHVVQRVNGLAPDMVAFTGDLITDSNQNVATVVRQAHEAAEVLGAIQCPVRFACLGNHDSINFAAVTRALDRQRFVVLENQHATLDRGGDRLVISGLADALFSAPDMTRALPQAQANSAVVLLGHEPDFAMTADAIGGADLMLSGHTHGGQVRLPLLTQMFLPDLGRYFVRGLYRVGNLQLNVNRGLGCMHLPIRFRCPPEITLLTLQTG